MLNEEVITMFPFVCDECGHIVEEDNGSPMDFLCFHCIEDNLQI